jgi:hypothetical protein
LGRKMESHRVNFSFGERRFKLTIKFNADVTDVLDVVDSAVVATFVWQFKIFKHGHHAFRSFKTDYLGKVFFYVYIVPQIFSDVKAFVFGLVPETSPQVPVPTCDDREVILAQIFQTRKPFVQLFEHFWQSESLIDLFLSDSCEFSAKLGEFGVEGWFDIVMKDI